MIVPKKKMKNKIKNLVNLSISICNIVLLEFEKRDVVKYQNYAYFERNFETTIFVEIVFFFI